MSKVKIQCPECGGKLVFPRGSRRYYAMGCVDCKKQFSENKIREKCGL